MSIKEEFHRLMDFEEISNNMLDNERKNIFKLFNKHIDSIEEIFKLDEAKQKVAAVILNILTSFNNELKNRKIKDSKTLVFSIKNIASITKISEKSLYSYKKILNEKYPELYKKLNSSIKNNKKNEEDNKFFESVVSDLRQYRRKTKLEGMSNKNLINIFNITCDYLKLLYEDKTAIKIKEFLAHIQVNLYLAGYDVDSIKLEYLFGKFYKHLNFELTDGRDKKDFVKIEDIYGNFEQKVFIELRR